MTNFLTKLIDAIPTPSPALGDKLVNLTLAFACGFITCMIAHGL